MHLRSRRTESAVEPRLSDSTVVEDSLPDGMKIAGAWSWRILAVVGVAVVFGLVVIQLKDIVIPLMIATLIAALLVPVVQFLQKHRWPKWLAVVVALVGLIVIVGGLLVLVVVQIREGAADITTRSMQAYSDFQDWLNTTFNINTDEFNGYLDQAWQSIQDDSSGLWSGALSVGVTAGHFLTGLLLTLFATIFLLIDGGGIWRWIVRVFPKKARPAIDGSGHAGWITLTSFVKVQILVAAVDATGIGLGAFILGLFYGGFPLVIPIAIAVFLGSFIPVVGAVLTGTIAILIALLYLGPLPAVIMLAIVLLVQQVEGHILQPLVMGAAVKVHPLAVVFAVAAGAGIAGIIGALFAVPLVATLNVMVTYIASGKWRETTRPELKEAIKQ
jgi:predicted PurR-regulated permease PerM